MYKEIVEVLDKGQSAVLATLVVRKGSGAREVGTKMLIFSSGKSKGSLGGGILDATVIKQAQDMFATAGAQLLTVHPEREGDEVCGSTVQVFLELITAAPRVVIAGAGHVGQAVADCAAKSGFEVVLVDDRTPQETGVNHVQSTPDAVFKNICIYADTFMIICSRSHALDYEILLQALATPAAFIGLLGSRRKKESFFAKLQKAGFADKALARIITPVGLPIHAQTPAEIGVSIVAQLISYYRGSAHQAERLPLAQASL